MNTGLHRLAVIAAIVAFVVIVLGAYVRLSHAGLGCPDWPGCYGQLTWPVEAAEVENANQAFPERPVETGKAWREMVHRYLAGILVLLVVAINVLAWRSREARSLRWIAGGLLALILFQAALGMWTVTLKLKPIVVMAHLMGGLATFSLLLWLSWRSSDRDAREGPAYRRFRPLILVGLLALIGQLALGGWTSANYAALVCPDFPTCQGAYWPDMDFAEGFVMWREIGVDYEGGVLDLPSRTAIQVTHRIGAAVVLVLLGFLALRLLGSAATRGSGALLGTVLTAQLALGILNVVLFLPLPNAVAHNAVGALLLATVLRLLYRSGREAG
ncbi:MAG: COX15/CtaA family protein [Xanthomonadales bacterium]|nr:COX15/CtaA family protein [Gammaproteobacteria bacterium]MBT8063712.1 COX15/CtaA family protein [Gammaproteobacteria bacterium]NNJ65428.1 COX15/CtaA family protein [Xanthomonadales bacterium]NNK32219.1 COX15/CtaA family protein [Xanthomonadales bacterium]